MPDLPVLTIKVPVRDGVASGTNSTPLILPFTGVWTGLEGVTYSPSFSAAAVTVGGTLSVARVHPGAGLLARGTVVELDGTGFTKDTTVAIAGVVTGPVVFLNSTQLVVLLYAAADLQGKRVTVRVSKEAAVDFYPDLQGAVDNRVSFTSATVQPLFPREQFTESYAGHPFANFSAVALQNTQSVPVQVTLVTTILINPTIYNKLVIPAGATLISGIPSQSFRADVYVQSSLPIRAITLGTLQLGLHAGAVTTRTVRLNAPPSPRPPVPDPPQFIAVAGQPAPLPQAVDFLSCSNPKISAVTDNGGEWLSGVVAVDQGLNYTSAVVNPTGLDAGSYTGRVTATCSDISYQKTREITLRVLPNAPRFSTDSPSVSVSVPATQETAQLSVAISAEGFPAEFSIDSDSPWLTSFGSVPFPIPAIPPRLTAPQILTVNLNAAGLSIGTYHANLRVSPAVPGLAIPLVIPVTLTVASSIPLPTQVLL